MSGSIQDKMVAFISARGEQGVTSAELTDVFLHPASAPPVLCARLIRNVLAGDPRVAERPDGKWAAPVRERAAQSAEEFCVIEALEAVAGTRRVIVEWSAVRVDGQGRTGETAGTPIRPAPGPDALITPGHLRGQISAAPTLAEAVAAAAEFSEGATVVSFRTGPFQAGVAKALVARGVRAPLLSLERLGRRLPGSAVRSADALATRLGVMVREPETARDQAEFCASVLSAMLSVGEDLGLGEPDDWPERQHPQRLGVDFSAYEFDREDIESLPESPGIYIMRDANANAVYVGKASNLRQRVKSYFRSRFARDEKTERILEALSNIEVEETGSELEALLAEYRAIRDLRPTINVQYDVHERPAAAEESGRLLVVLPSAEPECAEVFLLDRGRAMKQVSVARDEPDALRPVLEKFFFGETPPPAAGQDKEEIQIARRWLERNRDRANVLDVDLAGGLDETVRLLARYLREEHSGPRVFHV